MKKIEFKPSSIDYYENYINQGYNEILTKYLENLFDKYKWEDNYIQNKSSDKHQALWFGPLDYKYGRFKTLKAKELEGELLILAKMIEFKQGFETNYFNSVYINKYTDVGIGYHHDNDDIFKIDNSWDNGKDIIVAVISLGGEAKISIADKDKNFVGSIIAENNSLYIMNKDFQNNLLHKVGDSKGVRYSLTFRNCILK